MSLTEEDLELQNLVEKELSKEAKKKLNDKYFKAIEQKETKVPVTHFRHFVKWIHKQNNDKWVIKKLDNDNESYFDLNKMMDEVLKIFIPGSNSKTPVMKDDLLTLPHDWKHTIEENFLISKIKARINTENERRKRNEIKTQ